MCFNYATDADFWMVLFIPQEENETIEPMSQREET